MTLDPDRSPGLGQWRRWNQKHFSCGFHGWTFSCEGDLMIVTDEAQFRELDKGMLGLRGVYKPRNAGERISHQFFASRGRQVFLEDLNTLEAQHEVLSSGAVTHVQLSQQEMSLQHHYKIAKEMLADD